MLYDYVKRFLDFVFSLLFIIILSPVIVLVALLVCILSGSPILFKQKRAGLKGKTFVPYKFRTMIKNAGEFQKKGVEEDLLITREGKFLRLLHLDELPQLFNILKGDMSFVGPRPLVLDEYKWYIKKKKEYSSVYKNRPGLTGMNSTLEYMSSDRRKKIMKKMGLQYTSLKKLHGKKSIEYLRKKLEREIYYLEKKSVFLDIKIFIWTILLLIQNIGKVVKKKI